MIFTSIFFMFQLICYNTNMEKFNPKNIKLEDVKINPLNKTQGELIEASRNDILSSKNKINMLKLPDILLEAVRAKENIDEEIRQMKIEIEKLESKNKMGEVYEKRQDLNILNKKSEKAHEALGNILQKDKSLVVMYREYGNKKVKMEMLAKPINPSWN